MHIWLVYSVTLFECIRNEVASVVGSIGLFLNYSFDAKRKVLVTGREAPIKCNVLVFWVALRLRPASSVGGWLVGLTWVSDVPGTLRTIMPNHTPRRNQYPRPIGELPTSQHARQAVACTSTCDLEHGGNFAREWITIRRT